MILSSNALIDATDVKKIELQRFEIPAIEFDFQEMFIEFIYID